MIAGGLLFLGAGILVVKQHFTSKGRCTKETVATVYDYVRDVSEKTDDDGFTYEEVSYFPVFRYTVGDVEYEERSVFGSSSKKYALADEIRILYDPEDPSVFREPEESKWSLIIGAAAVLAGLFLLLYGILG